MRSLLVVVATTLLASMYQVALHNATRDHAVRLAVVYDRTEEALKTALGVGAKPLTGEDIFNAQMFCVSHVRSEEGRTRVQERDPEVSGKKTDLIRFVLNPQKVDPAFPTMPSQGLRPAEADSIASYLMKKVGVKGS